MVHPIQREQYGSYLWLKREVGFAIGLSREDADWKHSDHGRVESIVQSGLMQFYFSPPQQDVTHATPTGDNLSLKDAGEIEKDTRTRQPYSWSWLKQLLTVETLSGVSEYELPEDFAGPSGDLVISTGEGRLPIIAEEHLRAIQAKR